MTHKIVRIVVLFFIPLASYSQYKTPLNIGDSIPLMRFTTVFNKPGNSISISDFRGKLIILDFWNVWCGSCIEAFPKMEKLQKDFKDKIKIILVTNNTTKELTKLFKRIKIPALPIISDDTLLNTMFPHNTVPHHVWINPSGRIEFITDGYNTNEKNISEILEGKNLELHLKKEVNDFEINSPLWKEGNGRLQKYITNYSLSMTKIDENQGTRWSFIKDTINKIVTFKFVNIPLLDLYKMAFGNSIYNTEYYFDNRIIFNLPEGNKKFKRPLEIDSLPNWKENNLVCYESKWNLKSDSLAYLYLQNNINQYFPYSVEVQEKETDCYLLSIADKIKIPKSTGGKKVLKYTDTSYVIENMPISVLLRSLNGLSLFESIPVIDDTNYSANVDIKLIKAFHNLKALKEELLRNGFILVKKKKNIRMMIISEK